MKRQIYNQIREGIEKGIYKSVRLVRVNEDGTKDMVTTYSSFKISGAALTRLDHINYLLKSKLPVGFYQVEAKTGFKNGEPEYFDVVIKQPVTIPILHDEVKSEKIEDKTNSQQSMRDIDYEDYNDALKENGELKGIIKVLEYKIKLLEESKANPVTLNDAPKVPVVEQIIKGLGDNLTPIFSTLDRYFDTRNREIDLAEKKVKSNGHLPVKKKPAVKNNYEKTLKEMEDLLEKDPASFDLTLDEMEIKNPDLADYIIEQMGLEDEEQE